MNQTQLFVSLLTLCAVCAASIAEPFTYQGQLQDAGAQANGMYDIQFRIHDAAVGGSQVGPTITSNDVEVVDGVFQTQLDFGDIFDGSDKWLRVFVRPGASVGTFTELLPRQQMNQAPEAQFANVAETALNAPWTVAPGIINYGDGNDRVFINRSTSITSAEYFGVHGTSPSYNGMYISGPANSWPFYGYATNGLVNAYHYYNAVTDSWILVSNGSTALTVDASRDLIVENNVKAESFQFESSKLRYTSVSGEIFTSPTGNYLASAGTGGAFMQDLGSHWLVAPVNLPHGATVTQMTVYCDDTAAGTMSVRLQYLAHGGSGFNTICSIDTTGFNGSLLTLTDNTVSSGTIDHENRHYHVRVHSSNWPGDATLRIKSVRIAYMIDEAN